MGEAIGIEDIRTPPGKGGLLTGQALPAMIARLAVAVSSKPLRISKWVVAARHADVAELLSRDLDFLIAPINAARIDEVDGLFILGMDRGDRNTVERHALYAAMAEVDIAAIVEHGAAGADALIAASADGLDAVGGYARIVAGNTAARLFGVTGSDDALFREVARAVFAHTFLNVGNDRAIQARAVVAGGLMRAWLVTEIARRRAAGVTGDDLMGALMRRPELDDDAVRRTLGGMLVGAIDTTATAVAKIMVVLAGNGRLLASARADAGDTKRLYGWCLEALRRWPHNPIILRQAARDTALGGVPVKAGQVVVAFTQAAMDDPDAFPDPEQMRPDRTLDGYLHFGGGLHPCAGRAVNALQIPMLVGKLLSRGVRGVGPVQWAGPFPDHVPVTLERPR